MGTRILMELVHSIKKVEALCVRERGDLDSSGLHEAEVEEG